MATPYTGGAFLNWAHMIAGVVGALVQLAISYSLLRRCASFAVVTGASIQLAGGIIGAFSLPDWSFQILLYGESIFELGFCLVLLQRTRFLVDRPV